MRKTLLEKPLKRWKVPDYLLLSSLILFLTSCSFNLKKNTLSDEGLKKSLEKFCLNSKGKGRIQFEQEKFLFSYDSSLDLNKKTWLIGVNLPSQGYEEMMLSYSNSFLGSVSVKGSFYKRFYSSIKKNENRKLLKQLLNSWGKFLIWKQKMLSGQHSFECVQLKNESRGFCQLDKETKIYFSLKDNKRYSLKLRGGKEFTIIAKESDKNFYPSFDISLRNWDQVGPQSVIFELSFFLSSCNN